MYHCVACTAYLDLDIYNRTVKLSGENIGQKSEREIVTGFFDHVPEIDIKGMLPQLVSWYGGTFTMPVLLNRAIHYGIDGSKYLQTDYNARYRDVHLDVANWVKYNLLGGRGRRDLLNDVAQLIDVPPRIEMDVEAKLHQKAFNEVMARTAIDVLITTLMWLRIECVKCNLIQTDYDDIKNNILNEYRSKGQVFDGYISMWNTFEELAATRDSRASRMVQ
jgi:predicted PolB exonuclease-like 3'-5' exonuclease